MPKNQNLLILCLIVVVNALSYGTIIPLLYPYASRFGIGPLGLSLLFMSYSLFQFLATPVIGRLSDKYGRKPLLLLSIGGTSVSLAMFAAAQSIPMLFLARVFDGITGGNISVAQAAIADMTTGRERTKYFGFLGAAFGFGFMFGPALGGILSQISLTAPFWFAAGVALVATIMTFFMRESLKTKTQIKKEPLFNFKKMAKAVTSPVMGAILIISFLASVAHNAYVIAFQAFSVDTLNLSSRDVGLILAASGLVMVLMQSIGIPWLLKLTKNKKLILQITLLGSAVALIGQYWIPGILAFVIISIVYIIFFAPTRVMIVGILSEKTQAEDQGGMMGLNISLISLGQIFGPLMAGLVATYSIAGGFLISGLMFFIALVATLRLVPTRVKADL